MEIKMANENVFNDLKKLSEIEGLDEFSRKYFAYFIQQGMALDTLEAVFTLCADSPTMVKDFFTLLGVKQKWSRYELIRHCANAIENTGSLDDEELLNDMANNEDVRMFSMLIDMAPREFAYWVAGYMTVVRGQACESAADVSDDIVSAMRIALEHKLGMKGGKE